MHAIQSNQGHVGDVSMTIDPKAYPRIAANPQALKLLNACSAAFTWGGAQGKGSVDNPPAAAGSWSAAEKQLILAAATEGQATENASSTIKWTQQQQNDYAHDYGQSIAQGIEDSLDGKAAVWPHISSENWIQATQDRLSAAYKAAYAVYSPSSSGSPPPSGGKTDKQVASTLGTSLLIAVGASLLIAGGLWWWSKKEPHQSKSSRSNPEAMKLYQINDETESVTLEEFLEDNKYLDPEDVEKIRSLKVEEVGNFGGGAFADWKIRRVY